MHPNKASASCYHNFVKFLPLIFLPLSSTVAEEPVVFFELVNGRTEQTNKDATFRAVPDPENQQRVNIFLAKALEYEKEWIAPLSH